MTQPWVRVYPEDMNGDHAIRQLNHEQRWWLILTWHAAANSQPYGELRHADGSPTTPADFALVAGITTPAARAFFKRLPKLGLAVISSDGAVTFPKLAQHQGVDPDDPDALARARSEAGRKGAEARWQKQWQTHSKPMPYQKPEPEARNHGSDGQNSEVVEVPVLTFEISEATQSSMHALLDDLDKRGCADANTPVVLRDLARRGATAADFHDARQGIATAQRVKNYAGYAVRIIDNRLKERAA